MFAKVEGGEGDAMKNNNVVITVDKTPVPIPLKKSKGRYAYPWDMLLKHGDSFLVPLGKGETAGQLTSRIYGAGHNRGYKITTRAIDGGMRVWRIS